MKFCHVCIACKDWKKISEFYQKVFDCVPLDPPRHMEGEWAGHLIAAPELKDAVIEGEHLMVPGYDNNVSLTLEILTYKPAGKNVEFNCYDTGFVHICFEVPTIEEKNAAVEKLLANGGSMVSTFEDWRKERVAYCRDPEGNIAEIRRPNDEPDVIRK